MEIEQKTKWKGKEWITVLAPAKFGEMQLSEIAATEPSAVVGRTVEVDGSELTGSSAKAQFKLFFKIKSVQDKIARTNFHSLYLSRDWLAYFVRKRTKKAECIVDCKTKDGWLLHVKCIAVMAKIYTKIEKKVRAKVVEIIKDTISKSTIDEFLDSVLNGEIQKNIKKICSKIYPVKVAEIAKIEVLQIPK
jgi:small subunit ribosomal protein S3Ae